MSDNIPRCPLCGARSTWRSFPSDRLDLRSKFPDECHYCKAEDGMHWKDWEQGIDVTLNGSSPLNAQVEVPSRGTRRQNARGVKVA